MNKVPANILVVDDDEAVLSSAKLFLKQKFQFVHALSAPEEINKVLKDSRFDIVLLDMNYTKGENDGSEGLNIIDKIIQNHPGVEVLPITAYGEIDLAVEAMKRGARDFVTKPWRNEKLYATIMNLLNLKKAGDEIEHLKSTNKELIRVTGSNQNNLIGDSLPFKQVLMTVDKVAPTDANILILGENGTGKELIAQTIHQQSNRNEKPFIKVDIGSLTETLFESELFGHKKGAFTDAKEDRKGKFELANGGTLFLDEIGNISPTQQAKLLTAIQQKSISKVGSNQPISLDIRLITATNINLENSIQSGLFRQDLLYRINTIEIKLPSLCERSEDIPLLAQHYLRTYKKKYQKGSIKLMKEAIKSLQEYSWPGNIRELSHVIERAVILADQPNLTAASFLLNTSSSELTLDNLNIKDMEKSLILKALEKNKGNITHAARDLGIDRLALYRRLEKYGL